MTKICYISKPFLAKSLAIIEEANKILDEYDAQGFVLTLRQLYYQFVARNKLANTTQNYKRLGSIINDARLAGLIDWDLMEDRMRNLQSNSHWSGPGEIVKACAEQFHIDLWATQKHRPEVWIEKDALIGVIEATCLDNDVPYFSCRGYTSQSEMWGAAERMRKYVKNGQRPVIIHLGDHDPSGMDMSRDIEDRISKTFDVPIDFIRIALNMDQVNQYNPPPNPAKMTDTRAPAYVEEFGKNSWELDALEPAAMVDLVEYAIIQLRDPDPWAVAMHQQDRGRTELRRVASEMEDDDLG